MNPLHWFLPGEARKLRDLAHRVAAHPAPTTAPWPEARLAMEALSRELAAHLDHRLAQEAATTFMDLTVAPWLRMLVAATTPSPGILDAGPAAEAEALLRVVEPLNDFGRADYQEARQAVGQALAGLDAAEARARQALANGRLGASVPHLLNRASTLQHRRDQEMKEFAECERQVAQNLESGDLEAARRSLVGLRQRLPHERRVAQLQQALWDALNQRADELVMAARGEPARLCALLAGIELGQALPGREGLARIRLALVAALTQAVAAHLDQGQPGEAASVLEAHREFLADHPEACRLAGIASAWLRCRRAVALADKGAAEAALAEVAAAGFVMSDAEKSAVAGLHDLGPAPLPQRRSRLVDPGPPDWRIRIGTGHGLVLDLVWVRRRRALIGRGPGAHLVLTQSDRDPLEALLDLHQDLPESAWSLHRVARRDLRPEPRLEPVCVEGQPIGLGWRLAEERPEPLTVGADGKPQKLGRLWGQDRTLSVQPSQPWSTACLLGGTQGLVVGGAAGLRFWQGQDVRADGPGAAWPVLPLPELSETQGCVGGFGLYEERPGTLRLVFPDPMRDDGILVCTQELAGGTHLAAREQTPLLRMGERTGLLVCPVRGWAVAEALMAERPALEPRPGWWIQVDRLGADDEEDA